MTSSPMYLCIASTRKCRYLASGARQQNPYSFSICRQLWCCRDRSKRKDGALSAGFAAARSTRGRLQGARLGQDDGASPAVEETRDFG